MYYTRDSIKFSVFRKYMRIYEKYCLKLFRKHYKVEIILKINFIALIKKIKSFFLYLLRIYELFYANVYG